MISREEYDELDREYERRFGDGFPRMEVMQATDDEAAKMIRECLEKGEPLKADQGVIY